MVLVTILSKVTYCVTDYILKFSTHMYVGMIVCTCVSVCLHICMYAYAIIHPRPPPPLGTSLTRHAGATKSAK